MTGDPKPKFGIVVVTPPGKFLTYNPGTNQSQQYRSRSQNRGSGSGGGKSAYAAAVDTVTEEMMTKAEA